VLAGGQWHQRRAALSDLPHYTRVDQQQQQPASAAASADALLDSFTDGLEEIDIS